MFSTPSKNQIGHITTADGRVITSDTYGSAFNRVPTPQLRQKFTKMARPEVTLSKAGFLAKDPLTLFMFAYYADKQAFINAFAAKGILVHEDDELGQKDLEFLANFHKKGADIAGRLRDENTNTPIFFNAMEVYSSINLSKDQLSNSNIKFV